MRTARTRAGIIELAGELARASFEAADERECEREERPTYRPPAMGCRAKTLDDGLGVWHE